MKVGHQIRAFEQILNSYDGLLPLHRFLFSYFKRNKQMGSSDRRWASRYIYSFFRLGRAIPRAELHMRLAIADFLCNSTMSLIIEDKLPQLAEHIDLPIADKIKLVENNYPEFNSEDIFPFKENLSAGISKSEFCNSYFTQPDLFLRIEQGHEEKAERMLKQQDVSFSRIEKNILALSNGTKLEQAAPELKHYQVQDLSSQRTVSFFEPGAWEYWWDCCAASGGKSLLLHDIEPKVQLLVSDVREESLKNLEERFERAGINKYQRKVLDLLQNNDPDLHHYEFDGIILDAPCSGSGTWGRTPEMLCYFDVHKIAYFSKLQKTIANNVVKYLKEGKPLIYITCSVFRQENEEVIAWIQENLPLKLERQELIRGYNNKADTMFAARLIKR